MSAACALDGPDAAHAWLTVGHGRRASKPSPTLRAYDLSEVRGEQFREDIEQMVRDVMPREGLQQAIHDAGWANGVGQHRRSTVAPTSGTADAATGGTRLRGPRDPRRLSPLKLGAAGSAGDWRRSSRRDAPPPRVASLPDPCQSNVSQRICVG
jgi:hypothetical protein